MGGLCGVAKPVQGTRQPYVSLTSALWIEGEVPGYAASWAASMGWNNPSARFVRLAVEASCARAKDVSALGTLLEQLTSNDRLVLLLALPDAELEFASTLGMLREHPQKFMSEAIWLAVRLRQRLGTAHLGTAHAPQPGKAWRVCPR